MRDPYAVAERLEIKISEALENICNQGDPERNADGFPCDVNGFRIQYPPMEKSLRCMRDFPRFRRLMAIARPSLGEDCDTYRVGVHPEQFYMPSCWI